MRVFLAGATGVIGRVLVPALLEAGHEVAGMTRSEQRAARLREQGVEPVVCDAFDRDGVARAMAAVRPDAVINQLTDIPKALHPRRMGEQFETNDRLRREGTRNLVRAAEAAGVRRLISQSIAFAYAPGAGLRAEDDPLYEDAPPPWGRIVGAVAALEGATLGSAKVEGVVLRYGYLYGPGTSYAGDGAIAAAVRKRAFPIVGRGEAVYSFVHTDDAAGAALAALEPGAPGVYNVVDDEPAPVNEWLPVYAAALEARPPRRVPRLVARVAAGRLGVYMMTGLQGATNERARRELGWTPRWRSWRQGFQEALG